MSRKNPSTRWFFKDWADDEALATCSMAAQGFWMRMLCICAENDGYLLIGGKVPSIRKLARRTFQSESGVRRWVEELRENCVFSERPEDGAIFNRRMARTNDLTDPSPKARPYAREPATHHSAHARRIARTPLLPRAFKNPSSSSLQTPKPRANGNGVASHHTVSSTPPATLTGRSAPLTPQEKASMHWRFLIQAGLPNEAEEYVQAINLDTGLPPQEILNLVENAIAKSGWTDQQEMLP